jgi:arginine deiminase
MVINVEALKKAGVTVRIFENSSAGVIEVKHLQQAFVEVFIEHGVKPQAIIDAIKESVQTPEYQDALIENTINRVQTFQILEAIARTEEEQN